MQRVINRKLYDTEQAEQIARYAPLTDRGDCQLPDQDSRQRTAEETGMSTDDVQVNFISAQTQITDARQTIETIDKFAS